MSKHGKNVSAVAVIIIVTVLCSPFTYGASFDCTKTSTTVEKMICSDKKLSDLDSNLAVLYKMALSESKNPQELKEMQKQWLTDVRNKCTTIRCIEASYAKRLVELKPSTSELAAKDLEIPVRVEDLGENWQYKRDSEKVPEIMKAMKTVKTNPQIGSKNPPPFCRTFKKDFLAKKFQVIEPELQILSLDDPRFDKRWLRCNDIDLEDSAATNDDDLFSFPWRGRGINAEPPYRFYRVTMDTNIKNKGQVGDIVEYKEGKTIQTYLLVDLKGCKTLDAEQVISPKEFNPEWPDALSMLIRYQGRVMVLSYASYPSYGAYSKNQQKQPGESNYFVIFLTKLTRHEHESAHCGWTSPKPREASPKKIVN